MEFNKYIGIYPTSGAVQSAIDEGQLHKPYIAIVQDGNYIDWNTYDNTPVYSAMPLTFEITSPGVIKWSCDSSVKLTIQYNKNNGEWISITANTGSSAPTISVENGDKVQFRGNNNAYNNSGYFMGSTCGFKVYGNIMSLINSTNYATLISLTNDYAFQYFFQSCTGLTDASNLILPATSLTEWCYSSMFLGCTNLTTAPTLPATTLKKRCYNSMFYNCTSLNYIMCLAINKSVSGCLLSWVNGVSTTGTFIKHPDASWSRGTSGIPEGWTVIDADL